MYSSTTNKAEQTAAQAWDYLSSAVTNAGESASLAGKAGKKAAAKAGDLRQELTAKAGGTADEAWARATAALAALAGRKTRRPWGLLLGAGLAGVALGWAAASYTRAALQRQAQEEERELAETAVIVTP
jgi:hypothetical protein